MKKAYIEYNKDHKLFSRELRNNSTLGEILLWKQLKGRSMMGYQFNRQKPLANYTVDFYCKKLNLVIEVDGYSHQFKTEKDWKRDADLNKMGLSVLRFSEQDCRKGMMNVVRAIEGWIEENQMQIDSAQIQNHPNPLYKPACGGRGENINTNPTVSQSETSLLPVRQAGFTRGRNSQ